MTTPADKAELRARMRALRKRLAREIPDAAERAARQFPAGRLTHRIVGAYHPQGSELDPGALLQALCEKASMVAALPAGEARDRALVFRAHDPRHALAPDAFGIPSPPAEAASVTPDLLIVPLLAFDRSGARLGQGAGAYDRTIANLRASGRVFVLGFAYAGQEIEQIPAEPHDQGLDGVLTETGYIEF